jgi:1,4-dihydroxy-2-naphthoate octaprenyltransferase
LIIILFIFFYFVILSLFSLVILVTAKTRVLYLKALFKFSQNMLKSTEYLIKELNIINKINIAFNLKK